MYAVSVVCAAHTCSVAHALLVFTSVSLPKWLMLPVLQQNPAGHAGVTAATALGEGRGELRGQSAGRGKDMVKRVLPVGDR